MDGLDLSHQCRDFVMEEKRSGKSYWTFLGCLILRLTIVIL